MSGSMHPKDSIMRRLYRNNPTKRGDITCIIVFSDGFRKVIHMESGAIKSEWDDVEFHHPYFIRGEEALLVNIKRKV